MAVFGKGVKIERVKEEFGEVYYGEENLVES